MEASFALNLGEFFDEALKQDDSYNAIQNKVSAAIQDCIRKGEDMDCDGDGPCEERSDGSLVQPLPNQSQALFQMLRNFAAI